MVKYNVGRPSIRKARIIVANQGLNIKDIIANYKDKTELIATDHIPPDISIASKSRVIGIRPFSQIGVLYSPKMFIRSMLNKLDSLIEVGHSYVKAGLLRHLKNYRNFAVSHVLLSPKNFMEKPYIGSLIDMIDYVSDVISEVNDNEFMYLSSKLIKTATLLENGVSGDKIIERVFKKDELEGANADGDLKIVKGLINKYGDVLDHLYMYYSYVIEATLKSLSMCNGVDLALVLSSHHPDVDRLRSRMLFKDAELTIEKP